MMGNARRDGDNLQEGEFSHLQPTIKMVNEQPRSYCLLEPNMQHIIMTNKNEASKCGMVRAKCVFLRVPITVIAFSMRVQFE